MEKLMNRFQTEEIISFQIRNRRTSNLSPFCSWLPS